MTIAPEQPMLAVDGCECSGLKLSCGHCLCDLCNDCGDCSGGDYCICPCMIAELKTFKLLAEFYLGTHMTSWLWDHKLRDLLDGVTLFLSRVRLEERKKPFERALHAYCIDSGGFSELQQHGRWMLTAKQYVTLIRRLLRELGPELCRWVAPMDHMCEEIVIRGGVLHGQKFHGTRELRGLKPGDPEQDLTTAVRIHQRLTVDNYLELTDLAPEINFIAVLQGNTFEDYIHCDDLYRQAGIDLGQLPVVGLGSVCRRQATSEIREIVEHFHGKGYRLHGFGVKTLGLAQYAGGLVSADSMAWSAVARKEQIRLPGHTHKNCANCPDQATRWFWKIVRDHLALAA